LKINKGYYTFLVAILLERLPIQIGVKVHIFLTSFLEEYQHRSNVGIWAAHKLEDEDDELPFLIQQFPDHSTDRNT